MSNMNAISDSPIGFRASLSRARWIESPGFDTLLLIFVPLVTLPIIAGMYFSIPILAIGGGLTLAFAHYFSTLSFYFWDENREYHRRRWFAFFVGPVVIVVAYFLLLGFQVPYVIQIVLFAWNTFHVARQNCGILSIYRSCAGVSDVAQKHAANRAIIATSAFLAVWNLETHPQVMGFFGMISSDFELARFVKIGFGIIAATFAIQLALTLARRQEPIGIPEGFFVASSLGFFWPYLFIRDSGLATFAMLLPHYVQYMALVWLLHRRKFGGASAGAPTVLLRISANPALLIALLFAVGFSFYLLRDYLDRHGYEWHFESFYLLVALLHFYLDGLIWSFKRPHVRQTIGRFLLRRPSSTPA